jgi:hypothetical protein
VLRKSGFLTHSKTTNQKDNKMPPVGKDQFDADLAAYNAGVTDYIAAVDVFITNPAVVDLAAEDDAVKAALQAVTDAKGRIPAQP